MCPYLAITDVKWTTSLIIHDKTISLDSAPFVASDKAFILFLTDERLNLRSWKLAREARLYTEHTRAARE
jgi:hypothetical protein